MALIKRGRLLVLDCFKKKSQPRTGLYPVLVQLETILFRIQEEELLKSFGIAVLINVILKITFLKITFFKSLFFIIAKMFSKTC
jgi:hypothetical protein